MKKKIKKVLISVSDKKNLKILLKVLAKHKVEIISSGGTYKEIKKLRFSCLEVSDYTGSTRFVDRCKDMTVVRWWRNSNKTLGGIPLDTLLEDWATMGLISEKVLTESLIVRRYEQAIKNDATIKGALNAMAAELCVEMSIEDAIFNGLRGE